MLEKLKGNVANFKQLSNTIPNFRVLFGEFKHYLSTFFAIFVELFANTVKLDPTGLSPQNTTHGCDLFAYRGLHFKGLDMYMNFGKMSKLYLETRQALSTSCLCSR